MTRSVLTNPVLMCDKFWNPVGVATVKRAVAKLFRGHCRYIDAYRENEFDVAPMTDLDLAGWLATTPRPGQPTIAVRHGHVCAPEIVVFEDLKKLPRRKVRYSRSNVYTRDRHTCQYCGKHVSAETRSVDHVVPRALGGKTSWTNIVTCCKRCNTRKADKTLSQAGFVLLNQPVEPQWDEDLIREVADRPRSWVAIIGPDPEPGEAARRPKHAKSRG